MTKDQAWHLANEWVAAWNRPDLDLIMVHYEDAIELTSPAAAQLFGHVTASVRGLRSNEPSRRSEPVSESWT